MGECVELVTLYLVKFAGNRISLPTDEHWKEGRLCVTHRKLRNQNPKVIRNRVRRARQQSLQKQTEDSIKGIPPITV